MKLRLTKQFGFQMAHALDGYDGKCSNIHGHNFRLYVTVEGDPIADKDSPKKGMVIDFGDIKTIVEEAIIQPFDHALVLPSESPFNIGLDSKIIVTDYQPTSENLLFDFAKRLEGKLPDNVRLYSLKLYETDTSSCELVL